jgi:hypothetical protein
VSDEVVDYNQENKIRTEVTDLDVLSTRANDRVDGEMGVYEPHLVLETLLWLNVRSDFCDSEFR